MVLLCAPSLKVLNAITALGCIVADGAADTTKVVAFVIDNTVVFPANEPVPEITLTDAPAVILLVFLTVIVAVVATDVTPVVSNPLNNPYPYSINAAAVVVVLASTKSIPSMVTLSTPLKLHIPSGV